MHITEEIRTLKQMAERINALAERINAACAAIDSGKQMRIPRPCQRCGQDITRKNGNARYCSVKCREGGR